MPRAEDPLHAATTTCSREQASNRSPFHRRTAVSSPLDEACRRRAQRDRRQAARRAEAPLRTQPRHAAPMDATAIEFYDGDVAEGTDATRNTRAAHDLKKLPPLASSLATSSRLESGVQGGGQVGAARERAQRTRAGDPALAGGSRAQSPSSSGNLPPVLPPQEYSTTRWPRSRCSRRATRRSSSRARARRKSRLKGQRATAAASGRAALSAPPNPRAQRTKSVGVGVGQRSSERASADGGRLTRRAGLNSAQPRRGAQRDQTKIQKKGKPMLRQPKSSIAEQPRSPRARDASVGALGLI